METVCLWVLNVSYSQNRHGAGGGGTQTVPEIFALKACTHSLLVYERDGNTPFLDTVRFLQLGKGKQSRALKTNNDYFAPPHMIIFSFNRCSRFFFFFYKLRRRGAASSDITGVARQNSTVS